MSLEKERMFPIPVGIPHVTVQKKKVALVHYHMNKGKPNCVLLVNLLCGSSHHEDVTLNWDWEVESKSRWMMICQRAPSRIRMLAGSGRLSAAEWWNDESEGNFNGYDDGDDDDADDDDDGYMAGSAAS